MASSSPAPSSYSRSNISRLLDQVRRDRIRYADREWLAKVNASLARSERRRPDLSISAQGSLLEVKTHYVHAAQGGGRRGEITSFSAASRRRLVKLFAALDERACMALGARFITLTYGRGFPSGQGSKAHLSAFLRWIRRRWPVASGVWRLEFQKRGAPHYHFLFFGLPKMDLDELRSVWGRIIGWDPAEELAQSPRVEVQFLRSMKGVMSYVSKYIAKVDEGDPAGPEGDGAPLSSSMAHISAHGSSVGRYWGIYNKRFLPRGARSEYLIPDTRSNPGELVKFKRLARRYYKRLRSALGAGFFLITANPRRWLDAWPAEGAPWGAFSEYSMPGGFGGWWRSLNPANP